MKNTLALVLMVFGIVSCDSREISSTLICKDSSFLDGTEFKYTYLIDIDLNNQKVYVKETSFNPFYSEEENKAFDEAELYHLIQEEYDVEKWSRKFKNIDDDMVWYEKHGSWILDRANLVIRFKRDTGESGVLMYCDKANI